MDWVSGVVGLGGVAVALLALVLTYRSRFAPYQQQLYERQLDAATEVLQSLGRYHDVGLSVLDGAEPVFSTAGDGRGQLAEAKSEFFRTYRRWNVVIPQPVTEAVTAYLQTIEDLTSGTCGVGLRSGASATSTGSQLATAYAAVLGVAQRELRVRTLSDKTLSSIESLSGNTDLAVPVDPLYIKALAERSLFEDFAAESPSSSRTYESAGKDGTIASARHRLYVENRNLFLVHVWRPSARPGQVVDISIRLVEHERQGGWPRSEQASGERPLSDGLIEKVEYYLGSSFRRAFVRRDPATGFRLDVSAFGPTLCIAWVHFTDRASPLTLYRYLDYIVSPATDGFEDEAS
jgi:hypothetical protein